MKRIIILYLIIAASCQQSIDPFESLAPATCFMTVLKGGSFVATYSYNNLNQVSAYSDTNGNTYTFAYSDNGLLTTANKTYSNGTNVFRFTYDTNNKLIELIWGSNNVNKLVYSYNSSAQVTKMQYQYKNSSGNYISDFYQTFAYTASNTKNYSEINYYNGTGQLTGKETYQFDTQPNPFLAVNAYRIDWDLSEPTPTNNPIKIVYTPAGGTAQTTNFAYTYNEKGYRLTQSAGSGSTTVSYSYSNCQ